MPLRDLNVRRNGVTRDVEVRYHFHRPELRTEERGSGQRSEAVEQGSGDGLFGQESVELARTWGA